MAKLLDSKFRKLTPKLLGLKKSAKGWPIKKKPSEL